MWLNEGIAMLTVDRYAGKQTVRRESLELLRTFTPKSAPPTYQQLSRMRREAIAYHTARGYWLVRYLEEMRPGFLKRAFTGLQSWSSSPRSLRAHQDHAKLPVVSPALVGLGQGYAKTATRPPLSAG
jgi:hypothetical protein